MSTRRPHFIVPAVLALTIVTGIHVAARAADGGITDPEDGGTASADGGDASTLRNPNTATCGGGGPHADEMTLFGAGCC